MSRAYIDFSHVEPKHAEIHRRLENWARSCYSSAGSSASPMFRMYRSDEHWEGTAPANPVDQADADKIAKGVSFLPTNHRISLGWCYVKRTNPRAACKRLGVSQDGLLLYIQDARQMLVNRHV